MNTSIVRYLKSNWKSFQVWFPLLIAILLLAVLGIILANTANLKIIYDPYVDPIVAIITAVTALIIGFSQSKKNWEESLPKRLTVHFMYNGKCQLSCYEAYLSGTADIRMWSQQIGSQMIGQGMLSFFPYIDSKPPQIEKSHEIHQGMQSEDIMLYQVTFYLRNNNFDKRHDIEDKYVIWLDNSTKNGSENLELLFEDKPVNPLTIDEVINQYHVMNSKPNTLNSTQQLNENK